MAFDEEGNGVITKAELLKILKANHFASHDAEVARKADTIMAQSDKDGDGVITFDEFTLVAKKVLSTSTQCVLSPFPPRTSPHPSPQTSTSVPQHFISVGGQVKVLGEKPESCTVVVLVHTLSTMPIKDPQNRAALTEACF
jgi:EF-hand domain pair